MRRAIAVVPAGGGPEDGWPVGNAVGRITLPWVDRHRRRILLTDDAGAPFLLDLERATLLREGDGLRLEDGGMIAVHAAPEAVIEVAAGSVAETARYAWHLGNRHTPVQVLADGGLRLLDDPVLERMLRGLGASVMRTHAPFAPEAGAYARSEETPHHAHGHAHRHTHPHSHEDGGS